MRKAATKRTKRAKHTGRLEKRGNTYLAIYMVNGKRIARSTGESDLAAAEKKLASFLQAVTAADIRVEARRSQKAIEAQALKLQGKLDNLRGAELLLEERTNARIDELATTPLAMLEAECTAISETDTITAGTASSRISCVRRFLGWMERHYPAAKTTADVLPAIAETYKDYLITQSQPNTVNSHLNQLHRVWSRLVKLGKVTTNPWHAMERPIVEASKRRPFTNEELQILAKGLKGELRGLFIICIFTGLRLGDAAHLRWEDIDLAGGVITLVPKKTKRHRRLVKIPIVAEFADILEAVPKSKRQGYLVPESAAIYDYNRSQLSGDFMRAMAKLGIKGKTSDGAKEKDRNVLGIHALRHTYVSIAANAGIPFAVVQAIVGHSTAAMSERYFHENRAMTAQAYRAFPRLFDNASIQALNATGTQSALPLPQLPTAAENASTGVLEAIKGMLPKLTTEERRELREMLAN